MVLKGVVRPHRWHIEFPNFQPLIFEKYFFFFQNNGINTLRIVWTCNTTKYPGFF